MRWLFIFLVFVNLFFYIWQSHQITDNKSLQIDTRHLEDNIPTIKLLNELTASPTAPVATTSDHETLFENAHSIDNITLSSPTMAETPLTCLYVGGVTKKEQLAIFLPYLNQIDATLRTIEVELKKSSLLHLYLSTHSTEQQHTILAKLQLSKINYLIINRGSLKNQISLGYFASLEGIQDLQKSLDESQLAYQIEDLPVTATSYWLKIPSDKQNLFTSELLLELTDQLPSMQQQLMPCSLDSH